VELEHQPMGEGSKPKTPIVVEVDRENTAKNLERLDIQIPVLTPRIYREYKNLSDLDVSSFDHQKVVLRQFSEAEVREIVFRDITSGEVTHATELSSDVVPDAQAVIAYFSNHTCSTRRRPSMT
jgi:type III restriction enzyme